MKKWMTAVVATMLSMMLFAGIASAHVVVYPKETTQGTYEMFTLRVPTEKDVPTVKVEVKIPAEVDISRFEPKPGWKYDLTKDSTGKITSVVWTTTGDGLSNTEFGDFNMQGKVNDKATQLVWKAYQTYKDGSVVEWTGAADSKTPASITTVKPKPASSAKDSQTSTTSTTTDSSKSLYLSIAALVLGALALVISIFKRAK